MKIRHNFKFTTLFNEYNCLKVDAQHTNTHPLLLWKEREREKEKIESN